MTDNRDEQDLRDDGLRRDEQDLTPPHGDELRAEETFGRTDRYANVDDVTANRTEQTGDDRSQPEPRTPATNEEPDEVDRKVP